MLTFFDVFDRFAISVVWSELNLARPSMRHEMPTVAAGLEEHVLCFSDLGLMWRRNAQLR